MRFAAAYLEVFFSRPLVPAPAERKNGPAKEYARIKSFSKGKKQPYIFFLFLTSSFPAVGHRLTDPKWTEKSHIRMRERGGGKEGGRNWCGRTDGRIALAATKLTPGLFDLLLLLLLWHSSRAALGWEKERRKTGAEQKVRFIPSLA